MHIVMKLSEYQKKSQKTARYPYVGSNFIYPALGLAGESGEILNQVKKIVTDGESLVAQNCREKIAEELGELLWHVAQLATELDLDLSDIAKNNIKKTREQLDA